MQSTALMQGANPAIIPRNHLVENAIEKAYRESNLEEFEELGAALKTPFADRPEGDRFTLPPEPHEVVHQTFCGT